MSAASAPTATRAAELVSALVELESVNPELDPGGSGEAEAAGFVAAYLHERGFEVEIDEPAPGRPNVIARRRGAESGPALLLTGHLDTVSLAGEWASTQPRLDGERLYGRGAYDMKGGLAAILLAVDALDEIELAGDLVIGAVVDEEARSLGTTSMVRRIDVEAAIVTEPTGLELVVAHKGFAWFTVTASGHAAHGSRADQGRDAILGMAGVLGRLSELSRRLADRGDSHPLLGGGSVHASTIAGGTEYSTYPASCELRLERRTVPGETRESLEEEIRSIAAADGIDGVEIAAQLDFLREPFEAAAHEPILESLERSARAVAAIEARRSGYAPWTDAALLAGAGIPTIVFGPGGDGAHAEREWVDLGQVAVCAEILAATAVDFCGRAGDSE